MSTVGNENKVFGRDDFLNLPKAEIHEYFCDALQATVYLKELSALEQDQYAKSLMNFKTDKNGRTRFEHDPEGLRLKYLVRSLCDVNGKRLFKNDEYELLGETLNGRNNRAVGELYEKAVEINGGTEEEMEKNSNGTPEGGSNSD